MFGECGRVSLTKLVALAKVAPVQDLADTLETQLKGLGLLPAGPVGAVGDPDELELTGEGPERAFGRIKRKELTAEELALLAAMPVKVAKRMRPLMRAGLYKRLGPEMREGRNPFPEYENEFLRKMAEWLLQGPVVMKAHATESYMRLYGWTRPTAAPHVSVATHVMVLIGVAHDRGDRLQRTW